MILAALARHAIAAARPVPAEVIVRAWDSAGNVQPESAAQLWNPKGYANNSWAGLRFTVAC